MDIFTEILPETPSYRTSYVHFIPTGQAGKNRLLIEQGRHHTEYQIQRFAADGGQGFHFEKVPPETDPEQSAYDVFIADRRGLHDSCDCRGFQRHGHCKHTAAIRALLENQWIFMA